MKLSFRGRTFQLVDISLNFISILYCKLNSKREIFSLTVKRQEVTVKRLLARVLCKVQETFDEFYKPLMVCDYRRSVQSTMYIVYYYIIMNILMYTEQSQFCTRINFIYSSEEKHLCIYIHCTFSCNKRYLYLRCNSLRR